MKKTAQILSKFAYIIGALLLLGLSFGSFVYTFTMDINDLSSGIVSKSHDSFLLNSVFVIIIGAALYHFSHFLFKNLSEEKKKRRVLLLTGIISSLLFVLLMVWVIVTQIAPYWDQAQVYLDALAFNEGDFSDMNYTYLQMYPQQYGLIFFEEILLRIYPYFVTLQCFNALFIALSVFLAGRIVFLLSKNCEASFCSTVIALLFAPFSYYASFVYGDIFLTFAMLLVIFLLLKWFENGKWYLPILALITMTITVPVRENGLIFVIALAIFLFLKALYDKKSICLLLIPFFVLLPIMANSGIRTYFEHKSNITIPKDSIPSICWIAMGLQGDVYANEGVGYYNGLNSYLFQQNGYNKKATIESTKNVIKEEVESFIADPKTSSRFFIFKAGEQWLEPFFNAPHMNGGLIDDESSPYDSILYGTSTLHLLSFFLNYFNSFIYFFACIYCNYCIRHDHNGASLLPVITFIGGFLFSLIWEANGRYTFPFFILLIPLSAMGLKEVSLIIEKCRQSKVSVHKAC